MPKGQTSRPNNRKEKKAVATLKNLKSATKGFSSANKKTVMGGKAATAATKTLENRKTKAQDRRYGSIVKRDLPIRGGSAGGAYSSNPTWLDEKKPYKKKQTTKKK